MEGFRPGDLVAPGVEALEVGSIAPDEAALHIEAGGGALAFADGLIHTGGELGFVPDSLMGDDPEEVGEPSRRAPGCPSGLDSRRRPSSRMWPGGEEAPSPENDRWGQQRVCGGTRPTPRSGLRWRREAFRAEHHHPDRREAGAD